MNKAFLDAAADRFAALEAELNRLDAATGDGDHGTTMLRGLYAARQAEDGVVKAFRMASGGASGSLFGAVLAAIEKHLNGEIELGVALGQAADKVKMLGQANAGDKTMLDALLPAAEAAGSSGSQSEAAALAAASAAEGAAATTAMRAKRGRARYVEDGGEGHADAGARSIAELLALLAQFVEEKA